MRPREPGEEERERDYCRYRASVLCYVLGTVLSVLRYIHGDTAILCTDRHARRTPRLSNRLPEYTTRTCSSNTNPDDRILHRRSVLSILDLVIPCCRRWDEFVVGEKGIIDLGRHWNPEGRRCDERETARNLKKGSRGNNIETIDARMCVCVCVKTWIPIHRNSSTCVTSDSFTSLAVDIV